MWFRCFDPLERRLITRSGGSSLRSVDQLPCTTIIAHPSARIINVVLPAGWWSLVWREFHAPCIQRFITKRSSLPRVRLYGIYTAHGSGRYKNLRRNRYYRYVSADLSFDERTEKNEQRIVIVSGCPCFFFPLDLQRTRLATRLINIRCGKLVWNFFEYVFRVRRPFSLARNYAKLSFEKLFVGATSGPWKTDETIFNAARVFRSPKSS